MVGALIEVALNKITLEDLHKICNDPKEISYNSKLPLPPGYGLYLQNIKFNPKHLVVPEEEAKKKIELLELTKKHSQEPTEIFNKPFIGFKKFITKIDNF